MCCIVLPACIGLLFYCNHSIYLYRRVLIFCSCNSRVYVTPVKRPVLRILYTLAAFAFILVSRLAKEEVILPLFLICFGYSAPSVLSIGQRVSVEWKSILYCVFAMWTSSASGSEWDWRSSGLWDKTSRVHLASPVTTAVPAQSSSIV
jgi:hypothetical protein